MSMICTVFARRALRALDRLAFVERRAVEQQHLVSKRNAVKREREGIRNGRSRGLDFGADTCRGQMQSHRMFVLYIGVFSRFGH